MHFGLQHFAVSVQWKFCLVQVAIWAVITLPESVGLRHKTSKLLFSSGEQIGIKEHQITECWMLSHSYPRTWLGHTLELGSCWEHGPGMTQGSEGCASLVWQSLGLGWCCPEPGVLCMRYLVCQCRNSPSAGILPPLRVRLPALFPFPERSLQSCVGISLFSPKSCHHVAKNYQYLVWSLTERGTQRQTQLCRFTFAQPNSSCSEEKQVYTERGSGVLWRCCWGGSARRTLLGRACTFSCKQKLFWFCHTPLFKSLQL